MDFFGFCPKKLCHQGQSSLSNGHDIAIKMLLLSHCLPRFPSMFSARQANNWGIMMRVCSHFVQSLTRQIDARFQHECWCLLQRALSLLLIGLMRTTLLNLLLRAVQLLQLMHNCFDSPCLLTGYECLWYFFMANKGFCVLRIWH